MRFSTTLGHVVETGTHLGDRRAVVADLVHRGHVDAGDRGQLPEDGLPARPAAALPGADDLGDLADGLLAVADHEGVDEVGHGLGVERAVAPGDHDGVLGPAVLTPHRHAGEVEALQHVRVHQLGGEAEGEHVELARVVVGVDREQRDTLGAHGRVHVEPGRVGALGQGVVTFVEDLVEDLEALVGEPDLVRVGVHEEPGDCRRPMLRPDAPPLHPDVPSRLLDPGQEGLHPRPQFGHLPGVYRRGCPDPRSLPAFVPTGVNPCPLWASIDAGSVRSS